MKYLSLQHCVVRRVHDTIPNVSLRLYFGIVDCVLLRSPAG